MKQIHSKPQNQSIENQRLTNIERIQQYLYLYGKVNYELVAKKNPDGSKYFFHNDHLGSTSVITDQTGALVEETKYDPWGEVKAGGTKSKFLYTGQEKDLETGLNYYNFRYYDSHIRRFTQPDDIIQDIYNPQTLNRYSYVNNNPLRYTDPTGHLYEILAYNNALNQYYKKPSATTYNNVLNTTRDIQNQSYQPEKDKEKNKGVELKILLNHCITFCLEITSKP